MTSTFGAPIARRIRKLSTRPASGAIARSGLFDEAWYAYAYPQARTHPGGLLDHYLTRGEAAGLRPNPLFAPDLYRRRRRLPGVVSALGHFIRRGRLQDLGPLVDAAWYQRRSGVGLGGAPLLAHLLSSGSAPNAFFAPDWYAATQELGDAPSALAHYVKLGAAARLDPSPVFDARWYASQHALEPSADALAHFLATPAEIRTPNPVFLTRWYVGQYPDVIEAKLDPLAHYLEHGGTERRKPHPLFDATFYLSGHPEAGEGGWTPLTHYLRIGQHQLANFHPLVDVPWYLATYPDAGLSPAGVFTDIWETGPYQGRHPGPLFDVEFYLSRNPDVRAVRFHPLVHFCQYGWREGRDPNPLFDVAAYLKVHPGAGGGYGDPLSHYLHRGAAEGADPGPLFDSAWYLGQYPDVRASGMNPLAHYLRFGRSEGRHPYPPEIVPGVSDGSDTRLPPPRDRYEAWLDENAFTESARADLLDALAERRGRLPTISVVMPVYNTDPALLTRAIESVREQVLAEWELCIADDCSPSPATRAALEAWARIEPRIRLVRASENGHISRATNLAARQATGEVLAFLDHDDELHPAALAEIAIRYADEPDCDIVYTDDDKIDEAGRRSAPQFKPDWSPTLLLSFMYPSHLFTVRRALFEELGGFRVGFEGSQDFDFALRASEKARRVGHVPKILYHWRILPGSTALSGDAKPEAFEAGRRAVEEALARRGHPCPVVQPRWAQDAKVGVFEPRFPDDGPSVTIVVPSRNQAKRLAACLASIAATTYRNYTILVIDNASDDPATLAYLEGCGHRVLRVPSPGGRFSFSHLVNRGVEAAGSDYVLLLNDDTEVRTEAWLSQMMGYAQLPGVGAVGARLLYPDGRVQHSGIVHGLHVGLPGHAHKLLPEASLGYLGFAVVSREYSGVTGACLLVRRGLYLEMGGFDEVLFKVAYNDVDFCNRLVDAGYRCVCCASAVLTHHEGASRGFGDNPAEIAEARARCWRRVDPWYNPNLSLENERFEVAPHREPPHGRRPIRALFASHNLNLEGAPNSLAELAIGLARSGEVDPLVIAPQDGPLSARYAAAGIPLERVAHPLAGAETVEGYLDQLATLAAGLRQSGCDLVVANTCQAYWAVDAARLAGLPALWIVRESEPWGSYFDFLPPEIRQRAYELFEYAYRVVFVAEATKQGWAPLATRHNFELIPNGLDLSRIESYRAAADRTELRERFGIGPDEVALVLVGTVCDRKGQIDLVRATASLAADVLARTRILIVGDRPSDYSIELHEEADALPAAVRERIAIIPESTDAFAYYVAGDVAICCSRMESYPRVVLEAMAFGLPLVTTPVWGIREQTREGVNAVYYEPGDAEALAGQVTEIVRNGPVRTSMAANAQPMLKALPGYEEMLSRYAELMRQALLTR